MNQSASSTEEVNRTTNTVRDAFGVVSVAGVAILTLYAIAKMIPVWKRSSDEEPSSSSPTEVKR